MELALTPELLEPIEEGCEAADRGETISAEEAREHLAAFRAGLANSFWPAE